MITIVAGLITGVTFLYLINGGIKAPTPFLAQFTVILVLSTFSGAILRQPRTNFDGRIHRPTRSFANGSAR